MKRTVAPRQHLGVLLALIGTALSSAACGELLSGAGALEDGVSAGDAASPSSPPPPPSSPAAAEGGADGGAVHFCAGAALCTDFGPDSPDGGWDRIVGTRGAIELSTTRYVSPPSSLHVTLGARDASASLENVFLRHQFLDGMVRTLVDVELFLEAPVWGGAESTIALNVDGFRLVAGPGYGEVRRDPEALVLDPLPTDRWFHLRLVIDRQAGTVGASVDGTSYSLPFDTKSVIEPAAVNQVRLGLTALAAAPAISVFYDDLRVERF